MHRITLSVFMPNILLAAITIFMLLGTFLARHMEGDYYQVKLGASANRNHITFLYYST